MSTTPVPAESTAGIELTSVTERVTAAKVEALGPHVEGEARHVRGYCCENERADLMRCEGKGEVDVLRRGNPDEGNTAA